MLHLLQFSMQYSSQRMHRQPRIHPAATLLCEVGFSHRDPSFKYVLFPQKEVFSSVSVQGIFDSIMPNILPLGFVFLLYWLFKKKNVNTMKLILLVIALSVALSFLGIM